jgi:hypothetical protein
VNKFLLVVNGVVGSLLKVCESYSEAHLYLNEHFVKEQPAPSNIATTESPPSSPERGSLSLSVPSGEKRNDLFKSSMFDLGGRSMTGDQSKGKEGKLFGYSVLNTVKLSNNLVPDPDCLPEIMKKHFTEKMADFVACPWSEGQGGDLDGEHSELLTHALTTLGKIMRLLAVILYFEFCQDFRTLDHPPGGSQRQRYHPLPHCGNQF